MKYINKAITSTPYYIPLSAHVVKSYTVNVEEGIITANLMSYFNEDALKSPDVQPLGHYSVVLSGGVTGDTLDWVHQQLITEGASIPEEYNYQGSFQIVSRNTFAGGSVKEVGAAHNAPVVPEDPPV